MKTVSFHTLGCKVNQYETEAMTEQFLQKGYTVVDFDEIADVYVINTCTVTNVADKKSRKMLSKAKRQNPDGVIVAVGCYVQVAYEELKQVPYIDILIGNTHKDQIVDIVERYMHENRSEVLIESVHADIEYEELTIDFQQKKTRSTIKIQDGCNQYCTYCIIPYTRGNIRSRKPESVINEVRRLSENGYKEIILTGIHLGSYGKDLEKVNLIDLIEKLDKIDGIERIRLGSLEPNFVTEDLLMRLSQCTSVCPHFHLSMQSGSDQVLQRMKRRYSTQDYKEKIDLIRSYFPEAAFTTDVIVGFPMETDEEAMETYEFVKGIGFADLHVFKYSIREGTKAATMKPQVDGKVKQERSKALSELGEDMRMQYLDRFAGQVKSVIFEETITIDGRDFSAGYTDNYIRVYLPIDIEASDDRSGKMVDIRLDKLFEDGFIGKCNEIN